MSDTNNIDLKSHWNKAYGNSSTDRLGWYEETPLPSLQLIEQSGIGNDAVIFNAGAGSTTLVDELLDRNFSNIIVNDISPSALEKLKQRLGSKGKNVSWITDDLTHPSKLNRIEKVDLWHDRAVLHFFNDDKDQKTYFDLLRKVVKKGGFVIIAEFNLNGASMCSGLPVHRYDVKMIQDRLGPEFELLESFNYTFTNPANDTREYVYTLFKRI